MTYPNEPIAIIGSGCRFPGNANSPSALWALLKSPIDCLSEIPKDRFNWQGYYYNSQNGPHHGAIKTKHTHFLSSATDITRFDAPFFSIKPADAEAMDSQQRLLLETVYEGLENAGLTIESLRGSDTAVYVGLMNCDYGDLLQDDIDCIPAYAGTGVSRSIHSNRISWFFDWRGPSMTIDTACSSSMMAVHLAVQSLRSGEARVAVACGASVLNGPQNYIVLSQLGMISSDGRGRMWDANANGYSRGEGVASIILKPLSAAIADGDPIDCIIRETGVNHDGHTRRITVPSSEAQADLIRKTYARAGLDVSKRQGRPQYFEAHGTGTMVGDPREAEAVSNAFFEGQELNLSDEDVIRIGSIKTVIGHTEATAGLAGILKAALAVKHGYIPPNMLFESLNPAVAPYARYLCVPTELKPWPVLPEGVPRRASVNGFGFGGSNGHAILESFHAARQTSLPVQPGKPTSIVSTPFVFSAQSERSLVSMLENFTTSLESNAGETDLRSITHTLQYRKSIFSLRTAITASDKDELRSNLKRVLSSSAGGPIGIKRTLQYDTPQILGIFTGQGAQWAGMIQSLLNVSPRAREIIHALDHSLATVPREQDRPSWRIEDELMKSRETSRINEAPISQPLCTAVQILLVDMLRSAGVQLHAVVGHSSGEIAAAYAAGLITAADAIRIAYYRGLCARFAGGQNGQKGGMIATKLSSAEAHALCHSPQFRGRLDVAAYNSSANVVLSGDTDAIHEVKSTLMEEKKYARLLNVDTAYHSHHMLPCAEPYLEALRSCAIRPAEGSSTIWLSSVVPGQSISPANSGQLSSEYWVTNMTSPVLFADALSTTLTTPAFGPFDLGLEIGPHPALHSAVLQNIQEAGLGDTKIPYTGVLARGQNDLTAFAEALGKIWTHCAHSRNTIDFALYDQTFFPHATAVSFVQDLFTYPWDHSKVYWFQSRWERARRNRSGPVHSILGVPYGDATDTELKWRNFVVPKEIPWLSDHRIQGRTVFPAAGYAVMACEAALLRAKTVQAEIEVRLVELLDLAIHRAISFDDERTAVEVVLTLSDIRTQTRTRQRALEVKALIANWTVHSPVNSEADKLSLVCSGTVSLQLGQASPQTLSGRADPAEDLPNMVPVDVDEFYSALSEVGYEYTGSFRRISDLRHKLQHSAGSFLPPSPPQDTLVHPALLDTAFQALPAAVSYPGDGGLRGLQVPTTIGSIRINPYYCHHQRETMFFEATQPKANASALEPEMGGDVTVYTDAGDAFVQIESVTTVPLTRPTSADDRNIFSEEVWAPADLDTESGLAVVEERFSEEEVERAYACERAVYFYMRRLLAGSDVQPSGLDRHAVASHIQQPLMWPGELFAEVASSIQRYYKLGWAIDTDDDILRIYQKYPHDKDLKLIRAVGEAYPGAVKQELDFFKHCDEDIIDGWYSAGLGLEVSNTWAARLIKQISHRYPHMNIVEIGAGTGGLTTIILDHLGTAYKSYTYANTSPHFITKAQGKISAMSNKTIIKPLDLEKDPQGQGYKERSYDLVIVSNLAYTSRDLSQSLHRIRSLLRPGGFLVLIEPTGSVQQPARIKFLMAGLSLSKGTSKSPAQWHRLLQSTDYSGIETLATSSANPEYSLVCPLSVLVTQAVDDRVSILRQPLFARVDSEVTTRLQDLLIVGGTTLETARLCTDVQVMLVQRFGTIRVIETLEGVNLLNEIPTTILVLVELEDSIFKEMSSSRLQAIKMLWSNSHSVLWVLRGSGDAEPYGNMTIGLGRSVRNETRDLRLQFLDIEEGSAVNSRCLAEMILRLRGTQLWDQEGTLNQILWSTEPEYRLTKNGRLLIPRLYDEEDQNKRYNSQWRRIMSQVSPAAERVSIAYERVSGASRLMSESTTLSTENGNLVSIRVLCSLLSSLKLADGQSLFPLLGRRTDTDEAVFALSPSNTSVVVVPPHYTVFLNGAMASVASKPQALLLRLVWELVASFAVGNATTGEAILTLGVQTELLEVLRRHADQRGMSVISIIVGDGNGQQLKEDTQFVTIHPGGLKSELKAKLPSNPSVFLDLTSSDPEKDNLHNRLVSVLPKSCQVHTANTLFSTTSSSNFKSPYLQYTSLHELLTVALSSNTHEMLSEYAERLTISLHEIPQVKIDDQEPLTMIDWTAETTIPIDITPADHDLSFAPDRTYLLVGLTGDLGQSLCEWFIEHGAKQLILTSRNPDAQISKKWLDSVTASGITVKVCTMDVSDKASVQALYNKIQRTPTLPPIAGVANAAMVLHDTAFSNMSIDDLVSVTKPKVNGSLHLHEVFGATHPLDFFILFSSISYVVGNMGQANYAAANAFMAALVAKRRKHGLAGSIMHIGPIIGAGHITRSGNRLLSSKALSASGAYPLSVADFHQLFAEAVLASPPDSGRKPDILSGLSRVSIVSDVTGEDWDRVLWRGDPRFSHLCTIEEDGSKCVGGIKQPVLPVKVQLVNATSREQAKKIIQECFTSRLATLLRLDADKIDSHVPLSELGMDSLVAVEARSWFTKHLGVDVSILQILSGASVLDLVGDALEGIGLEMLPNLKAARQEIEEEEDGSILSSLQSVKSLDHRGISSPSRDDGSHDRAHGHGPRALHTPVTSGSELDLDDSPVHVDPALSE
ncbi:hypothetical protein BDW68DRAFT_179645 [Aspergillus falconensis]